MKKLLVVVFLSMFSFVYAQTSKCDTDNKMNELLEEKPELKSFFNNYSNELIQYKKKHKRSNITYTIPVVFHIVHNGGAENISKEQVLNGLEVINNDFKRLNSDSINTRSIFLPIAANCEIEFKLAQKDPLGNCTDGITRNLSPLSVNANNNVKSVVSWDNNNYLNIWVVQSIESSSGGITAGYAYLPQPNQSAEYDGILIGHNYVGDIGTSTSSANGRTLTHEVGHYLGLRHTFQDGCDINGDNCSDTPPVQTANYSCNYNANSCSSDSPNLPDQIENYMDYTDDACQNMFTLDQKDIMHYSLSNPFLRANLVSGSNLNSTGVNINPALVCSPIAEFNADRQIICDGESLTFSDGSYNGTPTSWSWSFPGGTPTTSTNEEPTVFYNSPGIYEVTLTTSNITGSDNITKQNFIIVKPSSAIVNNYHLENFENTQASDIEWTVVNNNYSDTWEITSSSSYSGTKSYFINNFGMQKGETHELVSPTIDLSGTNYPQLTFKYAFTNRNVDNNDILRIYVSYNCGLSWSQRAYFEGDDLTTINNPSPAFQFFPQENSEWKETLVNLASFASFDNILVKFHFTTGGGNNLFIDDFIISDLFSVEENNNININIYPNPVLENQGYIRLSSAIKQSVNIEIYDYLGKIVKQENKIISKNPTNVNVGILPKNGIYLIRVTTNKNSFFERFVYFSS